MSNVVNLAEIRRARQPELAEADKRPSAFALSLVLVHLACADFHVRMARALLGDADE